MVIAAAGDIPTEEALAATAILRERFPDLKIRFINVLDLYKLQPPSEHKHGLTDADFDGLFTTDKPIIFNFHGYPWLIHKLSYRRNGHKNLHVRGYKEQGNINTPLELAIRNQIDRFNLAIDVIDRVPGLRVVGADVKEWLKDQIIENSNYAYENGIDKPEFTDWQWPFEISPSEVINRLLADSKFSKGCARGIWQELTLTSPRLITLPCVMEGFQSMFRHLRPDSGRGGFINLNK